MPSYPKAKVRISSVQLICRKCGAIMSIDVGGREPTHVNEWDEVQFPPAGILHRCESCGKKQLIPDVGTIVGKVMGMRS